MSKAPAALGIAVLLAWASPSRAADEPVTPGPWKYETTVGLNLAQSTFSSNWAGGGNGSIVWVLSTDSRMERQFSTTFNLTNTLALAYGQAIQQEDNAAKTARVWQSPDKTTDKMEFESVGRWTLGRKFDPYAAFSAKSQFRDESDPRGAISFNPIELKESAGLARVFFKSEEREFISRFGFALRQTLGKTFVDAAGLEKESFVANDGGLEFQTNMKQPILHQKVLYKGTLLVYQPLFYSEDGELQAVDASLIAANPGRESIQDFWKVTDIDFQNTFSAQFSKVLGVDFDVQWVYNKFDAAALVDPALAESPDPAVRDAYTAQIDKNVRKAGQLREVLSIALKYRLF